MGFALTGVYQFRAGQYIYQDRSESDLEHCARTGSLAWWIANTPGLLPDNMIWDQKRLELLPLAARIHDLAERECGGDIPDDGTRKASQDDKEFAVFTEQILPNFPLEIRGELEALLHEFMQRSTPYGQLIYCADKTDALLRCLYYEELGMTGFEHNKGNITESSKKLTEYTGRLEISDVWFLGFLLASEDFAELREPFINLIRIGCANAAKVRPEREPWFTWWDKYLADFEARQREKEKIKLEAAS